MRRRRRCAALLLGEKRVHHSHAAATPAGLHATTMVSLRSLVCFGGVVAAAALQSLLPGATASAVPKLGKMRIPKEMQGKLKENRGLQSAAKFVEAAQNVGFFQQTDKTFATYLAEHPRFFALFYAPFSDECNEFLAGYQHAAESLVAEGFAANFTAVDCMQYPLLCSYHGLSRFPPPVVLYFDRMRARDGDGDKAFRKIALPPRVRAKPFMRGMFLSLIGELADPYQEWERWDTNGAVVHVSPATEPDWEAQHGAAVVVLFGAATSAVDKAQVATASEALLARGGVELVAINCEHHDETCVSTFKPHSFPALYFKHGGNVWKGFRGAITADAIVEWAGVPDTVDGAAGDASAAEPGRQGAAEGAEHHEL